MASVHLRFTAPSIEGLTKLVIYESADKEGGFTSIETVTEIGTYPNYISEYTTDKADLATDWFAISWEDAKGAVSELSAAVRGNASTLVGDIVARVELRDPSINKQIVSQEAAAVIEHYLPDGADIYDSTLTLSAVEFRGLTNLTLAMCYMTEMASTSSGSFVAGIVSMTTSDTALKNRVSSIDRLMKSASKDLRTGFSVIAYLEERELNGVFTAGMSQIDQSRLTYELR